MTTPTPGVRVVLKDGVEHTLRFSNAAIVSLEDEADLTMSQLAARLGQGSLKAIGLALWATLQHEEKPPTKAEALELIELARLAEISSAIGQAIKQAFGKLAEEAAAAAEGPVGDVVPEGKAYPGTRRDLSLGPGRSRPG